MEDIKEFFQKNCIVVKDGKNCLNELGAIVITFATAFILNKIFNEVGLNEEKNDKN